MNKARVLIVDDNSDFAESLAEVFEDDGCHVEIAYSGEEAVEIFRDHVFDITLMDMKLPSMNGIDSFLEFRKLQEDAKVVLMTGYCSEDLIRQAQDIGTLTVFYKPLDLTRLIEYIKNATQGQGDILLVDDDEDFVLSMEEFLREKGYTVVIAHSGAEAIEKIQTGNFRTLFLDLRLPVMNGVEVYMELKKRNQLIPTIIMTAFREEESKNIQTLLSTGCVGYLFKPFKPIEMLNFIESATN